MDLFVYRHVTPRFEASYASQVLLTPDNEGRTPGDLAGSCGNKICLELFSRLTGSSPLPVIAMEGFIDTSFWPRWESLQLREAGPHWQHANVEWRRVDEVSVGGMSEGMSFRGGLLGSVFFWCAVAGTPLSHLKGMVLEDEVDKGKASVKCAWGIGEPTVEVEIDTWIPCISKEFSTLSRTLNRMYNPPSEPGLICRSLRMASYMVLKGRMGCPPGKVY